jgi:FtsH-binding integral membrane protein
MNVGLIIAGSLCLVLAGGHTLTGRLVLDRLPRNFQPTRFGNGAYTRGLLVFTWHALSLMLTTTGAVLIALAQREPADKRGAVVFLVGAAYAAAALLLAWMTRKRPSNLLRIPVWAPFIVIIVLCWLNT